jgi:hypothetical protein
MWCFYCVSSLSLSLFLPILTVYIVYVYKLEHYLQQSNCLLCLKQYQNWMEETLKTRIRQYAASFFFSLFSVLVVIYRSIFKYTHSLRHSIDFNVLLYDDHPSSLRWYLIGE